MSPATSPSPTTSSRHSVRRPTTGITHGCTSGGRDRGALRLAPLAAPGLQTGRSLVTDVCQGSTGRGVVALSNTDAPSRLHRLSCRQSVAARLRDSGTVVVLSERHDAVRQPAHSCGPHIGRSRGCAAEANWALVAMCAAAAEVRCSRDGRGIYADAPTACRGASNAIQTEQPTPGPHGIFAHESSAYDCTHSDAAASDVLTRPTMPTMCRHAQRRSDLP